MLSLRSQVYQASVDGTFKQLLRKTKSEMVPMRQYGLRRSERGH